MSRKNAFSLNSFGPGGEVAFEKGSSEDLQRPAKEVPSHSPKIDINNLNDSNNSASIEAESKKRTFEIALPDLARGLGTFDIDYMAASFALFEDPHLKRRRVQLPSGDSLAVSTPSSIPVAHRSLEKDPRFSIRALGSPPTAATSSDASFEGKAWLDRLSLRLFAAPQGGLEALIDDEVDDAEVAYEKISSWLRCMVVMDDRTRRLLERDLAHPVYLNIRRTPNRPEELSADESELVNRYKAAQPFSIMIAYALSIILNRPYERIRDAWLGKVAIGPSLTLHDVRDGIQFQLERLQSVLPTVKSSALGSLSKKLLKIMRKAAKKNKEQREIRLSLLHSVSEPDALVRELTHLHQSLVLPDRSEPSAQVVTSREVLKHLQHDDFGLGAQGRLKRLQGVETVVQPPNTKFKSVIARLGEAAVSPEMPPQFFAPMAIPEKSPLAHMLPPVAAVPQQPKRRPGRPRKYPPSFASAEQTPSTDYVDFSEPPQFFAPAPAPDPVAVPAPSTAPSSELIDGYLDPKYIVSWDVSQGTSRLKLRCVNDVDDERFPSNIKFLARRFFADETESDESLAFTPGCACGGNCKDSHSCICVDEMYQHRSPYNENGCLVSWPIGYPIYECNSNCSCAPSCRNRVVQHGSLAPIEIFKTKEKGWGVRATKNIPAGTFICEYIGEIVSAEEAEKRGQYYDSIQCSYLYDLDMEEGECRYTIDAFYYGNVSRFINHCCDPNLQNYQVWIDNLDKAKPHVCLYARRDIKALEELSFDYKYEVLKAAKGEQIEHIPCKCGARNCRGVLF